ncbi:MAG TPA: hypothetical protein VI072_16040 [Polyangiaceae bacterium]
MRRALEHLQELHGPTALDRVTPDFPEDLATAVRYGSLSASSWYPIEWLCALHSALCRLSNAGPELSRSIGRLSAKRNFTTVHRAFISVLSPEFVIARAARVFSSYYDTGQMRIVESRPGRSKASWTGCKGFDRNLWEGTIGHCEGALTLTGVANIRIKVERGGTENDDYMDAIAFWTK